MADIHLNLEADDFEEEDIETMSDKLMAFIFPNTPRTESQKTAFNRAVIYQLIHEKTIAKNNNSTSVPDGVQSFSIGKFSMTFEDGANATMLNRRNICPYAYGVLLREGLLYKGVERSYV